MPKGKGYGKKRMMKKGMKKGMKKKNKKSSMMGMGGVVMRTGMAEGTLRS